MLKLFELPCLDPASLVGYQEDLLAKKRFERRFRLPSLIGALLVFGAPVDHMMDKIPKDRVVALVLLGFFVLIASLVWMFFSSPVSSYGRPMKKYWNSALKPGYTEALYVCEESKTYFIRVWGKPSRK